MAEVKVKTAPKKAAAPVAPLASNVKPRPQTEAEKRLKAIEVTTRIIATGSVKQVSVFLFYVELGITGIKELAQKEQQAILALQKRQKEIEEANKKNAKPVKKPQDRKPKVVKTVKKDDVKVS